MTPSSRAVLVRAGHRSGEPIGPVGARAGGPMRHASAHDGGTGGCSTAQRAMAAASGTTYSISEMFADGLGNGMALERGRQILRSIGKADKPALVPLLARTARTIDLGVGERREGPVLFRHDAQRLGRRTGRHWVRAIGKRAGIELVHTYMLRAALAMAGPGLCRRPNIPARRCPAIADGARPGMPARWTPSWSAFNTGWQSGPQRTSASDPTHPAARRAG